MNKNPWRKPYDTVMHKLGGILPILQMEKETIACVTRGLFSSRDTSIREHISVIKPPQSITLEEREIGIECTQNRERAPGLDSITTTTLVAFHYLRPSWLFNCLSAVWTQKFFLTDEMVRLILLRKGTKPERKPTFYRPLCLLSIYAMLLIQLTRDMCWKC